MTDPLTTSTIAMRPFEQSLPMALLQAREAAMLLFRPLLAKHGLTEQQWRVLRALAATDMTQTVGELADRTFLLGPSLTRILTHLDRRGLIKRAKSTADLRQTTVELTATGLDLVSRIAPTSESQYNQIEREFGAARLNRLLAELHALVELLPANDEEPAKEVREQP